ncbi:DUF1491 family protein [Novosphingobium sp.]|uniref:DUF1491 family protein n=1 Tax=Novosphingobium sp. TaxID=1874826 RepID=UPI0038BC37B5
MIDDSRLPARLEVGGLLRACESAGGFATVLRKGDPDSGTILVIVVDSKGLGTLFERLPQADGPRLWQEIRHQEADKKQDFEEFLQRRASRDPDLWMIELLIADSARFDLNRR